MSELGFCSCFVLKGSDNWKISVPDDWEFSCIEIPDNSIVLGHRKIDKAICKIFKLPDEQIVAITTS